MADETILEKKRVRPLNEALVQRFIWYLERYLSLTPEEAEEDTEISTLAHSLIANAVEKFASDIHIEPEVNNFCIRLRVDGRLHDGAVINRQVGMRLMSHLKVMCGVDPVLHYKPVEGWIEYHLEGENINLRLSCVHTIAGERMTLRLLDPSALRRSMGSLGLSEDQYAEIQRWLELTRGIFLVVGAIGSGKTTTLYSLLEQLRTRKRSVITVEDPVEYHLEGISQIQVNERRGVDFPVVLRSILRSDPDYIMVGEMRDQVSVHTAVNASTSGKIVLSTLHSRDAAGAITTLRNYNLRDHEISSSLELIVAQRLVRKLCLNCRRQREIEESETQWFELVGLPCPEHVWMAVGCEKCHNIGYSGRTGLFEVWQLDEESNELLLQHADERAIRRKLRASGVPSILQDGAAKVAQGITSIDEIRSASMLEPNR